MLKTQPIPKKKEEIIEMNSVISNVPLSFSSKTPRRKRSFCFLDIELDRKIAAVRKAGTGTLTLR